MAKIYEFTESELWTIQTTLDERYSKGVQLELAETEIRLNPSDRELTACAAVYWRAEDCNFIIVKTGYSAFRCQFFYRVHQQFGTGIDEYNDLADCVVSLLQVQADYTSQKRGDFPEAGA